MLFFVHQGELYVAHGLDAAQQLVQRMSGAIATGEATGVVVKSVDGSMPILEAYNDASFWRDVSDSLQQTNYNSLTRDVLAGMFGIIGGILTIPAGQTTALMADMILSEIYKGVYNSITLGSQNSIEKLFNFLDGLDKTTTYFHESGDPFTGMPWPGISTDTNTNFTAAKNWTPPRDPLVLDLDGDGIETAGIDPTAPVLFDMDGDGIRTATGWIRPDDGIVVLDRNGNGLIDSGRELFGDATVLARGARAGQLAANGFEALADLDLNADGRLDSLDASWGQLRIWRDLNQDGVSQAGELTTLAAQGIASLGAQGTQSNVNLGGGNTQVMSGSFTRTNGMLGTSGVAEVAGSLLRASNGFYREFTDTPQITQQAQSLPQMQGRGMVRDLREAMSLGTAPSAGLQADVAAFAAGSEWSVGAAKLIAICVRRSSARGHCVGWWCHLTQIVYSPRRRVGASAKVCHQNEKPDPMQTLTFCA